MTHAQIHPSFSWSQIDTVLLDMDGTLLDKYFEAWLKESLEGIDYNPALLSQIRKPDMEFSQVEAMYGIDQARTAYEKIRSCTTGRKMKELKQDTLLEIRIALKNCLGFIDDLSNG